MINALPYGLVPQLAVVSAWALIAAIVLFGRSRVLVHFRFTHLLPVVLQGVVYLYWCLYCEAPRRFLTTMVWQLPLAYGLDALLSLWKYRSWRLSFGPIPVLLSAGLFVQFSVGDSVWTLALVAVAIWARTFPAALRINPSALGLCAVGIVDLAMAEGGRGDVANLLVVPPNLAELVLIVGLVAQVRLRIVLMSAGAVAAILLSNLLFHATFSPLFAPILLAIVLFVTDPATAPKHPVAQLLCGALYGFLMTLFALWMTNAGLADIYSKVLPVPIVNLAAPYLDRWLAARRPMARISSWSNVAHVTVWIVVIGAALWRFDKGQMLDIDKMKALTPPHYIDHAKPCLANPLYCESFSFGNELRCWAGRADCHPRLLSGPAPSPGAQP
ncbi:MAG TPA: hypothetical protein DCQ06_01680 [Myxococcales bacterium]|nr:hypothetical protein [Myxococcales bacterium]